MSFINPREIIGAMRGFINTTLVVTRREQRRIIVAASFLFFFSFNRLETIPYNKNLIYFGFGKTRGKLSLNSRDVIRISKNFFSSFNARSSGACVTKFYSLFTE